MIGLWGFLLLTATEASWTNFVIFDQHYQLMAKCWFSWYERNASPNHLKARVMQAPVTYESPVFIFSIPHDIRDGILLGVGLSYCWQ